MKTLRWWLLLAGVAGLAGCDRGEQGPLVPMNPPSSEVKVRSLEPLWSLPPFSLTERSGQPVTLSDLKGKVWLADFFYTTCPSTCPMMSSRLSDLHKEFAGDSDIRLVSISTDPAKDTVEVLKTYAERFGASDRWLFLTGDKEAIRTLANEGFKLSFTEDPAAAEPITHSTKLVLIDKKGSVRGFYEGIGQEDIQQMIRDVRQLQKENL